MSDIIAELRQACNIDCRCCRCRAAEHIQYLRDELMKQTKSRNNLSNAMEMICNCDLVVVEHGTKKNRVLNFILGLLFNVVYIVQTNDKEVAK